MQICWFIKKIKRAILLTTAWASTGSLVKTLRTQRIICEWLYMALETKPCFLQHSYTFYFWLQIDENYQKEVKNQNSKIKTLAGLYRIVNGNSFISLLVILVRGYC